MSPVCTLPGKKDLFAKKQRRDKSVFPLTHPASILLVWLLLLDPKDPITIERLNLMNMAKLSIKGLIESALNLGRTLDSDYAPLQQFFLVMEHCLKHGLKSMRSIEYELALQMSVPSQDYASCSG